ANFETLRRIDGKRKVGLGLIPLTTRILTISALIFALSGATLWYEGTGIKADIVLAIDTSASMATQDLPPSRLVTATRRAEDLVRQLDTESRMGIITFSSATLLREGLTYEKDLVIQSLRALEPQRTGGTDIAGAITTSTTLLSTSNRTRIVVLMSDGSETLGAFSGEGPGQAIDYANENNVIIHTVGLGNSSAPVGYLPSYYNLTSTANPSFLRELSNRTGGTHTWLTTPDQELNAQSLLSSTKGLIGLNLTPWLILLSIILTMLEWSLSNTRFKRLP
ncbi:MAG: VWA domain-containing protein, partial [Nitrosarchaeum sp.]|nr:VWA domain-containing protein [Nitrosarchaeum sp.]